MNESASFTMTDSYDDRYHAALLRPAPPEITDEPRRLKHCFLVLLGVTFIVGSSLIISYFIYGGATSSAEGLEMIDNENGDDSLGIPAALVPDQARANRSRTGHRGEHGWHSDAGSDNDTITEASDITLGVVSSTETVHLGHTQKPGPTTKFLRLTQTTLHITNGTVTTPHSSATTPHAVLITGTAPVTGHGATSTIKRLPKRKSVRETTNDEVPHTPPTPSRLPSSSSSAKPRRPPKRRRRAPKKARTITTSTKGSTPVQEVIVSIFETVLVPTDPITTTTIATTL
ncbi:uncharacterized protein LOC135397705 isoform X2 [Ornithodoros turicata]|uniref:uncharacterized protein LOC135397705 isoform X2 n=1 Tax=Ornithodoros turicata TaxID=34597 RepID=UPI0031398396